MYSSAEKRLTSSTACTNENSENLWAEAREAADHVLANELARAWLVRALVDVDTLRA